ncbi:MAG: hypothetical protein KF830_08310 [Planctomycetes bacterium]|nr:hypothetical protein [Planctomycetota bacterium]
MSKNLADDLQRTARQALTSLSPAAQGEEPGGLPLRRLLAAAFRARYLVFATTLFGLLIGSFLAITTANTYVSVGKFLFTASGAESKLVNPSRATDLSQETIGTAATHILNTDDLLIRVIKKLGPDRILEPYQPGLGESSGARAWFYQIQRDWNASTREATEEEALKHLRRTLVIDRSRSADVLVATCTSNAPRLAQQILETYMKEAVLWHIEQYDDKRAYEDAERAAGEAKVALDAARLAMREFLTNRAGVAQFDAEKERLEKEDLDASSNQAELRQKLDSARQVLALIAQRLEVDRDIPQFRIERRRIDVSSNSVANLEQQLSTATVRLASLQNQRRDPNDSYIVEAQREIENIKAAIRKLQQDARNAPEEEVMVPNPEYTAMLAQRQTLTTEAWTLEAQVKYADGVVARARERLRALLDLEPEHQRLREALASAQERAEYAQANWNIAQQKRALGLGNFSSLKEIQAASMPLEKEGPNRGKLILGGLFGGLFLGLAIVLLRALPDTVVRTREDLERLEGLAVIGIMPRLDGTNLRRHVSLREQGW